MNRAFQLLGLSAASAALLAGCSQPAPPAEDASDAQAEVTEETAPSEEPTTLEVVELLAGEVARAWDGDKAIEQEISLTLKLRVEDKSALVVGAASAKVVTGAEAATTSGDIAVTLTRELARDIAEGQMSFKAARDQLETDNEDGLNRFLEFMAD